MVAKLNGRFQATITGDDKASQTQAVIDGAFTVAGFVEQTSVRLGSVRGHPQRVKLAHELANASERLINLVELAQMRVEVFGCTDFELDRLRGMREAVATSVRAQLVTTVGRLIDYGSAIVAGRHGLPFGVGAALTRQVERIGMLIRIVGGFGELDERLADRVAQATDITNEVVGIEAKALAMPNFHASVKTEGKGMGSVGDAKDHAFVVMVQKASRKIADLLESAVDTNRIGLEDLFDEGYMPIEGTNPQQHKTQFLALADQLLPEVQEAVLADNESIVFAVAVDRNGYLPTHNRKYSLPQGDNPVWNAAHCRNRRIFDDKCGLAAARNMTPILLQTYLRDMGGGEIAIMRDASSPITVKGRHWGGFRVAYPIGDV